MQGDKCRFVRLPESKAMALTFYQSKEWVRLRKRKLRQAPYCEVIGCRALANTVDHIRTVKAAPHLRLEIGNLNSLCAFHHWQLTLGYDRGSLKGACDDDGMPLDPSHPWAQPDAATAIEAVNRDTKPSPVLASRLKQRHVRRAR